MPSQTTASVAEAVRRNGKTPNPSVPPMELTLITPDMAANWLARGGKNRALRERRVSRLTAAIHRGEWQITPNAIALDADGKVRDGQHRLSAIVKAGVACEAYVMRGISEAAIDVTDTGRARTTADVLAMHGHPSANAVAGAARMLFLIERFGRPEPRDKAAEQALSTVSVLKYATEHSEIVTGLHLAERIRAATRMQGSLSTWAGLMTLFLRVDSQDAYTFAHMMATGEDMPGGHPVLLLRNRIVFRREGEHARSAPEREQMAALVIKAWNAFRQKKTLTQLAWRNDGPAPETFPVPL